jgi:hypothetical protein
VALCAGGNKAGNLRRAKRRQVHDTGPEPRDEQRADLAPAVTCGGREAARLHEMMVERGHNAIDRGHRGRRDGPLGARGWENSEQLPKRRASGGHSAQPLPSTATACEMPRQELGYKAEIDVCEYVSAPRRASQPPKCSTAWTYCWIVARP